MRPAPPLPAGCRLLALAAAACLLLDPSSGLATAILWLTGLYGIWKGRAVWAAWRNPVGWCFGLGLLWALCSAGWSFYLVGTLRDFIKAAPWVLTVMTLPVLFNHPRRIWSALVAGAGLVTFRLLADLIRLFVQLDWPAVLQEARYFQPYVYSHPNASSVMAGLCVLVFVGRMAAGRLRPLAWGLLGMGVVLDLAYLVVLASRGPQIVFSAVVLLFLVLLAPTWRGRGAALGAALLAGLLLYAFAGKINPRMQDETLKSLNGRGVVWSYAKDMGDERMWTGYGFGKKTFVKAVYEPLEREPLVGPFHYPHAHSYWLMLYFQGGLVALGLWGAGWLILLGRLWGRMEEERRMGAAEDRPSARRILPLLLLSCILFVLWYGVVDFPDHLARQAQFCLAAFALVLAYPSHGEAKRVLL